MLLIGIFLLVAAFTLPASLATTISIGNFDDRQEVWRMVHYFTNALIPPPPVPIFKISGTKFNDLHGDGARQA